MSRHSSVDNVMIVDYDVTVGYIRVINGVKRNRRLNICVDASARL